MAPLGEETALPRHLKPPNPETPGHVALLAPSASVLVNGLLKLDVNPTELLWIEPSNEAVSSCLKPHEPWALKEEKKKSPTESLPRSPVGVGVAGPGRASRRRFWAFREGRGQLVSVPEVTSSHL